MSLLQGLAGTFASGLSNLIGTHIGSSLSLNNQRNLQDWQYYYQSKLNQQSYDRQRLLLQEARDYESPSAARDRLEQAGLNPALMYGSGQSTTNPSIPNITSGSSSSGNAPAFNAFGNPVAGAEAFLALKRTQAEINNINADTAQKQGNTIEPGLKSDNLSAATDLMRENVISAQLGNEILRFDLQYKNQLMSQSVERNEVEIKNLRTSGERILSQIALDISSAERNSADKERLIKLAENQVLQNSILSVDAKYKDMKVLSELRLLASQVENIDSSTILHLSQNLTEDSKRKLNDEYANYQRLISELRGSGYGKFLHYGKKTTEILNDLTLSATRIAELYITKGKPIGSIAASKLPWNNTDIQPNTDF